VAALLEASLCQGECSRFNVPLKECRSLANPGTGSMSLVQTHNTLSKAYGAPLHHHMHKTRASWFFSTARSPSDQWWLNESAGMPCFLLTIRDPASRMVSLFREELIQQIAISTKISKRWKNGSAFVLSRGLPTLNITRAENLRLKFGGIAVHSLSDWLSIFRNRTAGRVHTEAQKAYRCSVEDPSERYYRNSAMRPPCEGHLIRQASYLVGMNCSRMNLHVLCTNTLADDWDALLHRQKLRGIDQSLGNLTSMKHAHERASQQQTDTERRLGLGALDSSSRARVQKLFDEATTISDEERAYIRDSLYPWDSALFEAVCRQPRCHATAE
jgi:hypothetical protein